MSSSANVRASPRTVWHATRNVYSRLLGQTWPRDLSLDRSEETALIAVHDQQFSDADSLKSDQLDESRSSVDDFSGYKRGTSNAIKETPKRNWRSYVWDSLDKSPEERRFLFKLDAAVLTFASLGYFIKNLDQININNAFVSGMKEDLGLYKNELNYMQTCWTVGYVLGEIPCKSLSQAHRLAVYFLTLC
jgi:hypothetical protein